MNQLNRVLTVTALCLSSSVANAQCKDGICTFPSASPATGYTSSYSPLPGTFDTGRFEPERFDHACNCLESDCRGDNCTCGPNCPPHSQSDVQNQAASPSASRAQFRNVQPLNDRNLYSGTLRAPRPFSNRYQATSYSVSVPWMSNYERGLEASRRSGRPMLVKISADWCKYCQQMKTQTYANQNVVRTISNGFIPVALDGDIDRKLIQQLGVRTLPAVVLIAPDLRIVDRIEGFKTPQQLTGSLLRHRQRAQLDTQMKVATR